MSVRPGGKDHVCVSQCAGCVCVSVRPGGKDHVSVRPGVQRTGVKYSLSFEQ